MGWLLEMRSAAGRATPLSQTFDSVRQAFLRIDVDGQVRIDEDTYAADAYRVPCSKEQFVSTPNTACSKRCLLVSVDPMKSYLIFLACITDLRYTLPMQAVVD
ncbi:unnamed protein product [Haemonchus placei]|uniref:EF-hand domain-containing protein n=1 Tax=Haemonchus placei TaxID=6290 RepID=A0A0N4WNN5_HAEPC|nr:unnamed protein product [Haemonchus placei]